MYYPHADVVMRVILQLGSATFVEIRAALGARNDWTPAESCRLISPVLLGNTLTRLMRSGRLSVTGEGAERRYAGPVAIVSTT